MNSRNMATDYLSKAERFLRVAREAVFDKDYSLGVRWAQESIELAVKAVLRCLGIEFPKEHDVSEVLAGIEEKLPSWFEENVPLIARIMREITVQRGPALYGYERELIPAGKIFGEEMGKKALKDSEFVYDLCKKFIEEWLLIE